MAVPAAAEVTEPLLDALIGMFYEGTAPLWAGASQQPRAGYQGLSGSMLIADDLPSALRARWQNRITPVADAE